MKNTLITIAILIIHLSSFSQSGTIKLVVKDDSIQKLIPNKWELLVSTNGDILKAYATKPKGLKFLKCEVIENNQTKIRATYRVSGKKSKEVEDFLVENYEMGELKWTCCGWDNAGKFGGFEHFQFKKMDPYCTAIISMYGSAEVEDKNELIGVKLETDRNKIDYFTVIVELVIV
ncbi:MAG: DUF4952 domain-containing protein [Flavobacteriaceae bacterium]|nr:DUF4952 domain-containing protein [Flavobacteriaceae bacterium]